MGCPKAVKSWEYAVHKLIICATNAIWKLLKGNDKKKKRNHTSFVAFYLCIVVKQIRVQLIYLT